MSMLEVSGLTHAFGDRELYKDAEFALHKGEHMGVIGQNGTGKSTLLKILLGEVIPTGGLVKWQQGIDIGHLDQYAQVDAGLTIDEYLHTAFAELYAMEKKLDALYQSMNTDTDAQTLKRADRMQQTLLARDFYAIDSHIAKVAAGLGLTAIGMDRRLDTLSGGQRTKAILGKLLLRRPDVLLLDEPTNFLDTEHIAWLGEYLRDFEGSFMIVSHDFAFLDTVTNCICDIEFQSIRKYYGAYSAYVKQKAHLREEYQHQLQAQQRQIARLEDYIARNKVRAATARIARGRQKQLDKIDRLSAVGVLPKPEILFPGPDLSVSKALEVENLLVGYAGPLLPKLSFAVAGGQKVVITGFNGIGKSTLLKTLMGVIPALGGSFAFHPSAQVAYFAQDMIWEDHGRTPLEIIIAASPSLLPKQARRALARYGVKAEHVIRPIGTLSGGEQSKVKLCLLSLAPSSFLILDEPTNHLDAETKEALREAIVMYAGSVILVCHETAFYQDFADQIINMEGMLR